MGNVKLLFGGTAENECFERVIEMYVNDRGNLFIEIKDLEASYESSMFTVLDKATAVRLSKELKRQISLMEE